MNALYALGGVCIKVNRNEAEVGSSVLKVLFSHLFTKAPSLFMKTWPQVARIKAFQWSCLLLSSFFSNPFSFSLRSIPGACLVSKGLMRLWILRWMLKNERNISPSLWVRKFWTQEDPFKAWWSASQRQQYVHSWQTEICLDSEHSHLLSKHQLSS